MSVFRVEKNGNFTIMSNHHLRDKRLSNKAKGLLSIILSLPEEWDYTSDGLAKICKDGVDGIRSQLRELESFGYITRERSRNEKGQLKGCDYTIHEIPVEIPALDKPMQEKPAREKPTQAKPRQSNTNISITDISNTYSSNNQSINLDEADRTDVEDAISEQIEAELLSYNCPEEQVREIVVIMADVICSTAEEIKVNGTPTKKSDVLNRYSQLNSEHIRYVLDAMERSSPDIKNIRAYLITALYNAPVTIDSYYSALFNKNQKGMIK